MWRTGFVLRGWSRPRAAGRSVDLAAALWFAPATPVAAQGHGALVKAGKDGPVCSICQEPHAIKRPDTAEVRHEVADPCGNCHERVGRARRGSFRVKAVTLEHSRAAAWADGHRPHLNLGKSNPRSSERNRS
jgi:hypothetical protein